MAKVVEVKNNVVRLPPDAARVLNGGKVMVFAGRDEVVLKPIRPMKASDIARLLDLKEEPPMEEIVSEVRKVRRARRGK